MRRVYTVAIVMGSKSYITRVFVKKCEGRFCFSPSVQVSSGCTRVCRVVYLFVCFPVLRVCMLLEGETACVGCYLLLQRVTANHQP